ncbi:MAG: hypothetical protein J4F43_01305 [Dehalococcoidia bacterium]|nr:hypothetical protein [Dehalococcoidia bacterium]
MRSFEELLNRLPSCDRFLIGESPPEGVSYVDQGTPGFVPPHLSALEPDVNSSTTQVLIVSAPGAVGKTTLAREIAFRKGALLWDLASAHEVARGSLNRILFECLDKGQTEDFLEYMEEGLQFIIVDALDEGRLKVNENSFQRLLEDIGRCARSSKDICFVLLGRTQIAETAWLVLAEQEVHTSIISIDSFDKEQANQYIDNKVEPGKRTDPFYSCRDLIFEQLAFSVNEGSENASAREFLHYPPVLDVVATLLGDESNLFELQNSLSRQLNAGQKSSIQLLQDVIVRILEREQTKVLPAVKHSLSERAKQHTWSDWESLYAIDEQCKRLLGRVLHHNAPAFPDTLPDGLRALYEDSDAINSGLSTHPFLQGLDRLANRVFESYLCSRAIMDDFGYELKQRVTQRLLEQEHLPSRLLAEFYLAGSSPSSDTRKTITPEHLGIIYDSLLSSESNRNHVRLNVDGLDPIDDPEGEIDLVDVEFEFLTFDSRGDLQTSLPDPITLSLAVEQDSRISFGRYLRDASITVPCIVELGVEGKEVTIGPAVQIIANSIVIRSGTLIVGGHTKLRTVEEDDGVMLEALSCDWTSLNPPPTVYDGSKFLVSWNGAEQYPWTTYRAERSQGGLSDNEDLTVAFKRFKRIATAFRSHGRGSLARTRMKIDHQRVLQGALGQALLDQLRTDGILMLGDGGRRYFWNSTEADKRLGVSWQDLRKWEIPLPLRRYLSRFIEKNPALFQ